MRWGLDALLPPLLKKRPCEKKQRHKMKRKGLRVDLVIPSMFAGNQGVPWHGMDKRPRMARLHRWVKVNWWT